MLLLNKVNKLFMSKVFDNKHMFDKNYFELLHSKLEYDNSLFNRSFLQYKAQTGKGRSVICINIILIFMLPLFIFFLVGIWIYSFFKRKNGLLVNTNFDIVAVLPYEEIIPKSLLTKHIFFVKKEDILKNGWLFDVRDLLFCIYLLYRYPLYPLLSIKASFVILQYSLISKMQCREVLVSNEYSFTSSILTFYLRKNKKAVSNCMHGDKVLCLRDCFSCYDNFYVWDEYYKKLLIEMGVNAEFYVDSCKFIELDCISNNGKNIIFFLQGIESLDNLKNIKDVLVKLESIYNMPYYIKPHPRYITPHLLDVFTEEKVLNMDYKEALSRCFIVCSSYSTILFQVFVNKQKNLSEFPLIAINDTLNIPRGYIMMDKADIKFSSLI
ncbi:hypothetical protein P9986_01810 [Glaesserella parasuis]|uniref:hypothetical protein n=1 Tax=Glaesserella parasuis TaxID=738 RepID=UPI00132117DC|nr:hypothetical protein [Glaesserella parasuis]MDG6315774.1 hypothetical protein [Glaesserella parasuis]MDG6326285.1 hypothetical protein [Glaesserella parasuis]MWQ05286.1 hypothetical protein [Glaesserella parasuis]MWQ58757.1 hypothetical protein [Glaesserella parasuis]